MDYLIVAAVAAFITERICAKKYKPKPEGGDKLPPADGPNEREDIR